MVYGLARKRCGGGRADATADAALEGIEKCFYDRDKKFYASFGFLRKLNPVSWK